MRDHEPSGCGRLSHGVGSGAGLAPTASRRQEAWASARSARSQPTLLAHKNRNQRNRAIAYERCVAARPPRCMQVLQVRRHRLDHHTGGVNEHEGSGHGTVGTRLAISDSRTVFFAPLMASSIGCPSVPRGDLGKGASGA